MPPATTTHHDPTPFLTFAPNPSPRRALILLNQPIAANNAFRRCFGAAEWHVVADGAADRLLDWVRLDGRRTLLEVVRACRDVFLFLENVSVRERTRQEERKEVVQC